VRVVRQWNRFPREVVYRNVQGQVGWGFEKPGVVKAVPVHSREFGIR